MKRMHPVWILTAILAFTAAGYTETGVARPQVFPLYGSAAEQQLLLQTAEGKFLNRDGLLSGLIASGMTNATVPEAIRQRLTAAVQQVAAETRNQTTYAAGQIILQRCFALFLRHYQSERTTLLDLLGNGTYNCVSSAYLFNYLATQTGYRTRAVVVPGHVYSQFYSDGRWIDVETTSRRGFDPFRKPPQTPTGNGRAYIPDKGAGRTHIVISNVQLLSLIFYNRGTLALESGRPGTAAPLFYRALLGFPGHFESKENLLAAFIKWGRMLVAQNNHSKAAAVAADAIRISGKRSETEALSRFVYFSWSNAQAAQHRYADAIAMIKRYTDTNRDSDPTDTGKLLQSLYARWAQHLFDTGNYSAMERILKQHLHQWKTAFAANFTLNLVSRTAVLLTAKGEFQKAITLYDSFFPYPDSSTIIRQNRQVLYNKQVNRLLQLKQFARGYRVLQSARKLYPDAGIFEGNLRYLMQEWGTAIAGKTIRDAAALHQFMQSEALQPLKDSLVHQLANRAMRLIQAADHTSAEHLLNNLSRYRNSYPDIVQATAALAHSKAVSAANNGNYREAILILSKAIEAVPGATRLSATLRTLYYNGAVTLINNRKPEKALLLINSGLQRFPGEPALLQLKQHLSR